MLHFEDQTLDLEDEERVETAVVGLRYTGPNSVMPPQRARDQGGWPGNTLFQGGEPGPIQIGIVPDTMDSDTVDGGNLAGLENLGDFEVIYDPSELAKTLLDENYLPPAAFGGNRQTPNYDVREALFDHLGLDDELGTVDNNEEQIRSALADIADMDLSEDETPPDASREREYADEYSRGHLYRACNALGFEAEWQSASKTSLAEQLATRSAAVADAALEATEDGEADLTDEHGGPETVDDEE